MKTLVAYYSKSGTTEACAKKIAEILGADTFAIRTAKEYPKSYLKTLKVSRAEFKNDERPEIIGKVENMDEYDKILVGFPVWFGTCPMAVATFLEQYDWAGKEIYPFCTSTSTGIKKGEADVARFSGQRVHTGLRMKNVKELDRDEILSWVL